ncbi:5-(carboxyamino)imidazole ribonucleotide synthase [Ruicaihuangia caeni]|uniref:N5-carboxyaminoimidazole ribonucleotide synthase n=1 Tax=Ruicaihuangia caeni TaxID=3042517 RepID=A0AAW6TCS7_9MICO|nr:5-(carboxyamino)imidazole ribonucleotide synthase [Klugiella sp. YN-L-19]MDI2099387.1 5-(carboxyamino)imidazole ribonucleotide synthase [Klugiella sp. YN-L-19]
MTLKVGVIGGGQLARMMIPAAINLGLDIRVLAETEGMSAALAASEVGDYRDLDTVLAFAETVDVVTFDHEHVPQPVLRALVERGVEVHPGPDALQCAQDKIDMRARLTELGLPVPAWAAVETEDELQQFIDAHGGAAVVKTARGGYDGKGVRVVRAAHEATDWFTALAEDARGGALLAEELVDFSRELAQLVARRPSGDIAAWPVVETLQRDGVCVEVIAPAPAFAPAADEHTDAGVSTVEASGTAAARHGRHLASPASADLVERAEQLGRAIAEGLGVTGVLAVEIFEARDGRLLVNELAMRPHNSGHFSIDGSTTSQFEQHLRAVLDLPLGDTSPFAPWSVMVNILGGPQDGPLDSRYGAALAAEPTAKIHNYGKDPRPGRKVGHVTVTGDRLDDVLQRARAAAAHFA